MRRFAEHGYEAMRVEDLARELGIAKGSIFQHFGSKERLFLAAHERAVRSFPAYLDAPDDVRDRGFFETVRYWLERTDRHIREDWVPYRVTLIGTYGSDLSVRREIGRFLEAEDPYGVVAFVRWGIERGDVRTDIDDGLIVAMVDWLAGRFQDALVAEELDPGLFRRHGDAARRTQSLIDQFVELLRSAIGFK